MIEILDAMERAGDAYRDRLAAVPATAWEEPSVCDGWTVREVAEHVLGGNRFAVELLAGASADAAFTAALGPGFEGDPVELATESLVAQLAAFRAPGALEVVVDHPAGAMPGREFAALRTGDLLLHGWDLARSTGGDTTLDPEVAELLVDAYTRRIDAARAFGVFGPATGEAGDGAPIAARLLDLTGRRA